WLMMSLWDALRMNMMISYQELVRTFPNGIYNVVLFIHQCLLKSFYESIPRTIKLEDFLVQG
ncbi:hypothetical protein OLN68_17370, partial [Citrobacter freundii]|nr:hypothetical protein [Citrobacter freundii]MCW1447412.1 hypothetical protein [Citrobacter freundii]